MDNMSQLGSLQGPISSHHAPSGERLSHGESDRASDFRRAKLEIVQKLIDQEQELPVDLELCAYSLEDVDREFLAEILGVSQRHIEPSPALVARVQAKQNFTLNTNIPLAKGIPDHPSFRQLNPVCAFVETHDLLQGQTQELIQLTTNESPDLPHEESQGKQK